MRCMKMPRSQSESENVQFVQELAEVDGPFEAPININFRDLIKLELPSLVWNRGDTCPKKMKLTNTGHTVIVSGKWKCERPYLTGGPLLGKYVFSQIHFHWGQDDCKGSEHQICGEGFPLEMHVAHFKTEYMTQENALREKDGMVVVVYLFKLQEEPNQSLKKIINLLSNVKQPSTSQVIDPRPILSLCNPFTDDYFMYWGSVVTSTCAHILLWLICREPFGISREQVKEFRKIMDSSQQPIFRNSKEIQPVHKRNVFHVNASKHLDEPLLPVKKLLGCYCKGNEDKDSVNQSNDCNCQGIKQNQEEVEGHLIEYTTDDQCLKSADREVLQSTCFANQTFFVHTTQVQSVSILLKRCGSDPFENYCHFEKLKKMKSEGFKELEKKKIKLISQSCCYLPLTEVKKIKNLTENNKIQKSKKLFHSVKAFSQIMQSLESLKNHTFKKLKEIESINQEIKEIKPFCQNTEEKKWIRKIEKVMTNQKRFTIKSSQGCLTEIRKLAKDFNLDKFFDAKVLSEGDRNQKVWMSTNKEETNKSLLCYGNYLKGEEMLEIEKSPSKYHDINNAIYFSSEAQKLIESFFEDIKESEDLQESVKKDLNLEKIKSFYSRHGNSNSIIQENKNYITQKMFTLGNLGNRFFTEVTTEDYNIDENQWKVENKYEEELISTYEINETKNTLDEYENLKPLELEEQALEKNKEAKLNPATEALIPLHRAGVGIFLSKTQTMETMVHQDLFLGNEEKIMSNLENSSDAHSVLSDKKSYQKKKFEKFSLKKSTSFKCKNLKDLMCERLLHALEAEVLLSKRSGSDFSTESTEIQRMILSKIRQSRKDFWELRRQKSSGLFRVSSRRLYNKANCKKFDGYYMQKKKPKMKKRKSHKSEKMKQKIFYDQSSTSKEEENQTAKQKWKRMTKAKFKFEIQKKKNSTSETSLDNFLISPDRKRLKLESKKLREGREPSRERSLSFSDNNIYLTDKETRTIITNQSPRHQEKEFSETEKTIEQECSAKKSLVENFSEEQQKFSSENITTECRNISRGATNTSGQLRASSAGSQLSHIKSKDLIKPYSSEESLKVNDTLKKELPSFTEAKLLHKNKSLSNISNSPKLPATYPKMLESLNVRRKSNKESFIPIRKLESPKKAEERLKSINTKDLSREVSKETYKQSAEKKDSKASNQTFSSQLQNPTEFEYKIGPFRSNNSSQVNNELLPLNQVQPEKGKKLKQADTEKFHFTKKSPSPLSQEPNEEPLEVIHRKTSNKSFAKDSPEGNEDSLTPVAKDFQISASYSTLKEIPVCRPHSAESLLPQTKTIQHKGKKRPHCSKRNSRHYIKKNSSIFKRPNKSDKHLNFLNLTEEEQLKIISVNVAKYLKEKLQEKDGGFEETYPAQDFPLINTEETITETIDHQMKKENWIEKIPNADKNLDIPSDNKSDKKPDNAPVIKAKDEKEEKPRRIGVLRKPKIIRTQVEVQDDKPDVAPPKPANNFVKLNKQMAGKYKKLPTPLAKKEEIKVQDKPKPENKPSTENSKSKATTPKKKKEETPSESPEPKEQTLSKPQTPKSPKSSQFAPKKIPQKESQLRSPRIYKKTDSGSVEKKESVGKFTPPASIKMKCGTNLGTLPPSSASQKIPRPKEHLNPKHAETQGTPGTPCLSSPTTQFEDETTKMNTKTLCVNVDGFQTELYSSKTEKQEEVKNENLFEKELEYFIKLQKCLNNDLIKNLENPTYYEKSKLLHQNYQDGSSAKENLSVNYPVQNTDPHIKRIITMETKDLMECSSTNTELPEELANHNVRKLELDNKNTKNVSIKTTRETDNFGIGILGQGKEKQEETNSDSSYDCKISITLNTNPKEGESTVQSCNLDNWLMKNSNSQTTCLEGSTLQSTVMTPLAKKRNEGDISIEMKEKLLEILEGEINREIAIKCGSSLVSWRKSNDRLTVKEEDSDGNNQSRSTASSCDNIEILTQISNTMRQYLTYMKQLPDRESQE